MKLNLSARFLMLALLCGSCVLNTPKEELEYNGMNTLQISNVDDLISFYQYADDRIPLISGHRGGRGKAILRTVWKPLKIPSLILLPRSR